jgi:voltage-gated potassium channel
MESLPLGFNQMRRDEFVAFEKKYQLLRRQLVLGMVTLGSLFGLGTIWYYTMEQWSWADSAYMTMITLSTVGFGEIHPLGQNSRLFTIILILLGVMAIGYIVNRFTELIIQDYFQHRNRLKRELLLLENLSNHYIVCGYGRMGRQIVMEFEAENIPFVIVDNNPERIILAQQKGYISILGDATLDESLLDARINKALCLVAALKSDAENLYTILSAKTLNPKIRAIARASSEEAVQKLQRAGADAVVSPYITGAKRLASAALRPQVMDFVDGVLTGADRAYYMEEFLLAPENCIYVGKTLKDAQLRLQSGSLVLAIRRVDGNLIVGPTGDTILCEGDMLICMGTAEQLRKLNQILDPLHPSPPRIPKK